MNFNKKEFRTFVINNKKQLADDIKASRYNHIKQAALQQTKIERTSFKIPAKDIVYLDAAKNVTVFDENVYEDYTSDISRSLPEKRFEAACKKNENIKWFYKNGDKGQKYLSIIYYDNFNKDNLFYPDYLVMTKDGRLFIIETKGGEDKNGESRNIDKEKVEKKFEALKNYVQKHNTEHPENVIYFAFVRDVEYEDDLGNKTYEVFYNNDEWTEKMGEKWKLLKELFDMDIIKG